MLRISALLLSVMVPVICLAQSVPPGHSDQIVGVVPGPFDGAVDELVSSMVVHVDGTVYVTESQASGDIYRKLPGGSFTFYTRLPGESAIGLGLVGDWLYAGGNSGGLYGICTWVQFPVAIHLLDLPEAPLSIVGSGNGHLLVGTSKGLYDVDLPNAAVTLLYAGDDVDGVAADPTTGSFRFVEGSQRQISRLDLPATVSPFFAPTVAGPDAIAVQPVTGEVYLASAGTDTIQVIDAVGSASTAFATGIRFDDAADAPSAMAFSPNGDQLYYGTVNALGQFEVRSIDGFPPQIDAQVLPPAGAISGHATLFLQATDAQGASLDTTFEFSTNGGVSFATCTTAPGSFLANPTGYLPSPINNQPYTWNTIADRLGMSGLETVLVRISVTDGGITVFGLIGVDVDNAWPTMNCMINPADGPTRGNVEFVLDMMGPPGSLVAVLVSYSVDDGTTWQPARAATSSMIPNPALGLNLGSIAFTWDTASDGVGVSSPSPDVAVRLDVTDSFGVASSCETLDFAVDNVVCGGTCGDCDMNGRVDIVDALKMAQVAAALLSMPAPTSPDLYTCNVTGDVHPAPAAAIDTLDALVCARFTLGLDTLNCCVP